MPDFTPKMNQTPDQSTRELTTNTGREVVISLVIVSGLSGVCKVGNMSNDEGEEKGQIYITAFAFSFLCNFQKILWSTEDQGIFRNKYASRRSALISEYRGKDDRINIKREVSRVLLRLLLCQTYTDLIQ